MSVVPRAVATFTGGNETTGGTITFPASTSIDDDCYVWAVSRVGNALACTDDDTGTGNVWDLEQDVDGGGQAKLFHKKATVDTANKTITIAGATNSCAAGLLVVSGAVAGDPTTNLTPESNTTNDHSQNGFTPAFADSLICLAVADVVGAFALTAASCTNPGAITKQFEWLSTGGSDSAVWLGTALQVGGPTATGTFSWTQAAGQTKSLVWAIKPALGGTNPPVRSRVFMLNQAVARASRW